MRDVWAVRGTIGRRRWARGALGVVAALSLSGPARAQSDADCAAPQEKCGGLLSRECLSTLGAGAAPLGETSDCAGQMTQYRDCLAEIATNCPGRGTQRQTTVEADKLEELARLGGVIEAPETAVEFYNNALVFARRGDLLNGRKMLEKAIAAGATQIDVHQRYVQLLKAQEGLIGAREIIADLARRSPENKGAALAAATLAPAPERKAALEALLQGDAPFAPAYYELAALFSADRVGAQSINDQRAEKAALEKFLAADEAGRIYRWFLEKDVVEVWRESARRRLAFYANRNLDVAPVSLSAQASNDGWMLVFQILEPARRIRYRIDEGEIKDTGLTTNINPQTGEPMPRSFVNLPLGAKSAKLDVWYDNIRGEEEGPFRLAFSADAAFTASAKRILGSLTQTWIQDRDWDGAQLVYFTHLISHRCGLSKIEYSVESASVDQTFPLSACDPKNPYAVPDEQQIYLEFKPPISAISVRLTYADGEASDIREFRFEP